MKRLFFLLALAASIAVDAQSTPSTSKAPAVSQSTPAVQPPAPITNPSQPSSSNNSSLQGLQQQLQAQQQQLNAMDQRLQKLEVTTLWFVQPPPNFNQKQSKNSPPQ